MKNFYKNSYFPYLVILVILLIVFSVLSTLVPKRVGDGSEYYALFYAWAESFRPWMTEISFKAYENLFLNSNIVGLVSLDWLRDSFPGLRIQDTADFNHFWFYSFLAYLCSKLFSIIGVEIGPHQSFLFLHLVLLTLTFFVSYRLLGWKGVVSVYLLTLTSPMLWFFDKVHTELLTYCLTLISVLLVCRKKYLAASFSVAIASTQNPSFAIIAFLPFAYRFLRYKNDNFSISEALIAIGTSLLVLVHPVYYFFRFGVPTPQLLAGGASLGGNLSNFYIWLVDPDVGLLPNWPFGILLTAMAIMGFLFKKEHDLKKADKFLFIYILFSVLINFYAHSSTTNINSGATVGVARYALWYLPLFFPLVYYLVSNYPRKKYYYLISVIFIIIFTLLGIKSNNPSKYEDYSSPNYFSFLLQNYASFIYNPPPEVFAERYSGIGEAIYSVNPRGILGPDCRKILIYPGDGRSKIIIPKRCYIDESKLSETVSSLGAQNLSEPFYYIFDRQILKKTSQGLAPGKHMTSLQNEGVNVLDSGWSDPEEWGVWSDGKKASLRFKVEDFINIKYSLVLHVVPFLPPNVNGQAVSFFSNKRHVFDMEIKTTQDVELPLYPDSDGFVYVELSIKNPISPKQAGLSEDPRFLGVGLMDFELLQLVTDN